MKLAMAFILAAAKIFKPDNPQVVSIPSCAVTPPAEHETWSKRDMQRVKGKAARKNRGKNRSKHEIH